MSEKDELPDLRSAAVSLMLGQMSLVDVLVKKGLFTNAEYNESLEATALDVNEKYPEVAKLVRLMKTEGGM